MSVETESSQHYLTVALRLLKFQIKFVSEKDFQEYERHGFTSRNKSTFFNLLKKLNESVQKSLNEKNELIRG